MAEKLEPCPFCGSSNGPPAEEDPLFVDSTGPASVMVYCGQCGCEGPFADDEAEAIRLWNRRPRIEPPADSGEG